MSTTAPSNGQADGSALRIATFNVNNVNRRLPNLLAWLGDTAPDIVCLQELKAATAAFPRAALASAGYGSVWEGERQWNGVAILARGAEPVPTRRRLPGEAEDRQSRYVEAAVRGVLVGCLYAPNGNPKPGPRWDYKLRWLRRLRDHAAVLLDTGAPTVLAGDWNVVPTDRDIYPTRSWARDALLGNNARALFRAITDAGWTDALARFRPADQVAPPPWTFWDYKRNRWARDAGLRIDHMLVSPSLLPRVLAAGVDRAVRGADGASDHAPVWLDLADPAAPVKARDGRRRSR